MSNPTELRHKKKMQPTGEQIKAIWLELDKPGPEKLQVALRKRGFESPSAKQLREGFYKFESSRQVFRPPPKYTGHIYATRIDNRWCADVMQLPAAKYDGKAWEYALMVVDIFSRFAWAALIDSPMQAAAGYREILGRAGKHPSVLLTDGDPGFKTPEFKKLLGETVHEIKSGKQDLAIVDNLIFRFKRRQRMAELDGEGDNWAAALQKRIAAFNSQGAPALYGSAPDDLRGKGGEVRNPELQFQREWDEAHQMQENSDAIESRGKKFEAAGAFRTQVPFKGVKRRAGDPVWSLEKHTLERVSGPYLVDTQGRKVLSKEALAVHRDSDDLVPIAPRVHAALRTRLREYADRGKAFLLTQPDRRATASTFHNRITDNYTRDLKAAMRGDIDTKSVVRSFVAVYPELFKLTTSSKGGVSHVQLLE